MAAEREPAVSSAGRTTVSIKLDIPDDLKVPEGSVLLLQAWGEGVQSYECDQSSAKWTFKKSQATLYDEVGNLVGTHSAGTPDSHGDAHPTWQANDDSTVVGTVKKSATNPDAIPSLLLEAASHDGSGLLSTVLFIQRLNPMGGRAPDSCTPNDTELQVNYTALYRFYGPVVPSGVKVVLLFQALGIGKQVYECKPSPSDSNKGVWTFKEPIATLYNDAGHGIGTHFKGPTGPTWQTNDGSTVVGTILNSVPNPNAIPSLLLAATSHDGCGLLSKVLFIQRVDTVGGTAPGESCDLSHDSESPVKYTALYRFYSPAS
jgi:Protein of unknown function (DUF3455)